jgi:hypothetical protein
VYTECPGVKVSISGFNSRADAESKTSYTHGSNSQQFRSYEFLNVQLQICHSALKQVVQSGLHLLG